MAAPEPPTNPVSQTETEAGELGEDWGWRQRTGLMLGALIILGMWLLPPFATLGEDGTRVALLALLMGVLWITEAVPIPATALLPLVLLPLLGVSPIRQAAAPYAGPVIYLFMGGFMLALAMERWNLRRRIALAIISAVGTKPRSLVLGFLCAGAAISMWTSNSATAMMLLPIGMSAHGLLKNVPGGQSQAKDMGAALVLAVAYGANIGGMGTLIGTPPNAIAYSSGLVTLPRMLKAGIWVNLLFAILIPMLMWTIGRWIFGLS
ncbi:MAG: SLC13 family permease [Opitutaceae bacterium]